jgi:uncharacterized protein involved in cysteine biosynthesis
MMRALILSIEQLGDRAILMVLAKSLALTAILFVAAGATLVWSVQAAAVARGWTGDLGIAAGVAAGIGAIMATWLLFRAVAVPVIGLFADEVVAAVERRHYPASAALARPASLAVSLWLGVLSLVRMIGVNLLMLPVYAILLFTVVGSFIALLAVNALLLGRDLGEMVAVRHLDGSGVSSWLRATRGERAILGLLATALFMVPFANFLAPVIGAAMARHLFHRNEAS